MPNSTQKPPIQVTPKPAPLRSPAAAPRPNLAAGLAAAQVKRGLPIPKTLTLGNTNDLNDIYFRGCIYGEMGVRKTTTAALFGTSDEVKIVMTRNREQLTPLKDMGYEYALVEDAQAMLFAIRHPEQLWPQWAKLPNRTLVIDDISEGELMLIESQEQEGWGKEYRGARDDLRAVLKDVAAKKPMHIVLTALAKVRENDISLEERVGPDLTNTMLRYLLTEVNYVFYIDPKSWQFLTDRKRVIYKGTDDKGRDKTYTREIYAKNKLSVELAKLKPPLIKEYEKMDLRAIWDRIVAAKAIP